MRVMSRLWLWYRKRYPVTQVTIGTPLGIYLVPGVFRVASITYNTDGQASIILLKEDRFLQAHRAEQAVN